MSFSVSTKLTAIDRLSKVFKKIGGSGSAAMKRINGAVTRVNRKVNNFSKSLGGVGKIGAGILAGFSFAAVTAEISDTIQVGKTFQQTMISAAAKFPEQIKKGTKEYKELSDVVKGIGATTEFQAVQAAEGLKFLAMAGFNAKQAMVALPSIVDVATSAEVDLARAVDIATDSLDAFNLKTKDTEKLQKNLVMVSDVMAKAANTSNISYEQLFETIKEGGGVANSAGIKIQQFSAMAGLISGVEKGGKAGTSLKNIILRLQAPTSAARKRFKELGISVIDSAGKMKSLDLILDDLNRTLPEGAKRAEILDDIFGKIPIAAVSVLLQKGGQELRDYTKEMYNAAGSSKTLAAIMRDSLEGDTKRLSSAIEGFKIQLFEAFEQTLTKSIKILTKFVDIIAIGFSKLGPWGPIILDIVASLAAAVAIVGVFTGGIIALNAAIGIFNMLFVASPIGLIILAIAGLIFLIVQLIKHFDAVKNAVVGFVSKFKIGLLLLMGPIGALISGILLIKKGLEKIGILKKGKIEIDTKVITKNMNTSDNNEIDNNEIKNPQVANAAVNVQTSKETKESIQKSSAELKITGNTQNAELKNKKGNTESFKLNLPPSWSF